MWARTKTHPIENATTEYVVPSQNNSWRDMFSNELKHHGEQGLYLKGLRLREGYTQVKLGFLVGISASNISAMERGRRSIGKGIAKRMASIFKVSYRNFL